MYSSSEAQEVKLASKARDQKLGIVVDVFVLEARPLDVCGLALDAVIDTVDELPHLGVGTLRH